MVSIGQLSSKHKIHIVHSSSMGNLNFTSNCGMMFSKNEVQECDNFPELLKSKLLCERCKNIWIGK